MPHIIIEHSANLKQAVASADLVMSLSAAVIAQTDEDGYPVYPLGGLRARTISCDDYRIGDGTADYGFVHVTLKVGAGRSKSVERATASAAFDVLRQRLGGREGCIAALSVALERLDDNASFKHNEVHAHLRMKAESA